MAAVGMPSRRRPRRPCRRARPPRGPRAGPARAPAPPAPRDAPCRIRRRPREACPAGRAAPPAPAAAARRAAARRARRSCRPWRPRRAPATAPVTAKPAETPAEARPAPPVPVGQADGLGIRHWGAARSTSRISLTPGTCDRCSPRWRSVAAAASDRGADPEAAGHRGDPAGRHLPDAAHREESGNAFYDQAALRAIMDAEPVPAAPRGLAAALAAGDVPFDLERRPRKAHAVLPSSSPRRCRGGRAPPRDGAPRRAQSQAPDVLLNVIASGAGKLNIAMPDFTVAGAEDARLGLALARRGDGERPPVLGPVQPGGGHPRSPAGNAEAMQKTWADAAAAGAHAALHGILTPRADRLEGEMRLLRPHLARGRQIASKRSGPAGRRAAARPQGGRRSGASVHRRAGATRTPRSPTWPCAGDEGALHDGL